MGVASRIAYDRAVRTIADYCYKSAIPSFALLSFALISTQNNSREKICHYVFYQKYFMAKIFWSHYNSRAKFMDKVDILFKANT